ncbi:MAG: DUF3592 domain-containing protein [Gammaproteobacteria bacterium]|nr:DUF3592 domain-containing protein [Gammaproteobacteria bacterium]
MNLYPIILALVALGGIGISLWGWMILQKSRRTRQWPRTTGRIEVSEPRSAENDLLPEIVFSYRLDGKDYRRPFTFPEGTHPLPEFATFYNKKYPVGAAVDIYYKPDQPEIATLEPGAQGDWMILAMGIAMTLGGTLSLLL